MKELPVESETLPPTPLLNVVSSQGFCADQTHGMRIAFAGAGASRKVKC